HRRKPGELLDGLVRERADHDAVDVAREHASGVTDGLAPADLDVTRREEECVAAKLVRTHLERHARARRTLLEDHRERLPGEGPVPTLAALQAARERQQLIQLFGLEVGNREKVPLHLPSIAACQCRPGFRRTRSYPGGTGAGNRPAGRLGGSTTGYSARPGGCTGTPARPIAADASG